MLSTPCHVCGEAIEGADLGAIGEAGLAHVRVRHPDEVPYPDMAVSNYFEGQARMNGGSERLAEVGEVEIHPVTEERQASYLFPRAATR